MKLDKKIIGQIILHLLSFLFLWGILQLDLNSPMEFTLGSAYTLIILYSWILAPKYSTVFIAFLSTGFIMYKTSMSQGSMVAGISGILSIIPIWVSTSLVIIAKRSYSLVDQHNKNLKGIVRDQYNKILEVDFSNQMILRGTPNISLITLDKNGIITSANKGAENLLELTEFELLESDINQILPDLNFQFAQKENWNHHAPMEKELEFNNTPVQLTLKGFLDQEKKIAGFSLVLFDKTTSLKFLNFETRSTLLQEKKKEFDEIINITSHYVQEPLSKVKNINLLFEDEISLEVSPKNKRFLKMIMESYTEIENLINGLLDYSVAGRDLNFTFFDTMEAVLEVTKPIHGNITEIKGDWPSIYSSRAEFKSIIQELIDNAIFYNRKQEDLKIILEYKELDLNHKFMIRDNGIGINPDHHDKVFDIFKTIGVRDNSRKGIGLSIAKKLCQFLNGKLQISNQYRDGLQVNMLLPKKTISQS